MIKLIRREVRNLWRVAPNDNILEKIKEVESSLEQHNSLKHGISEANESFHSMVDLFVDVLCESIKFDDVELSMVAQQSLKILIENNLVSSKSLQLITDTLTKIKFDSKEPELVGEGYHQAVRVCLSMVKCRNSHELSNGSISEIIIFCFRVVNSKLVKWLRSKAARTLLSVTKIVFKRLKEFPEDPCLKPSYQIRIRLGGASSQSTFKELADQSLALNENSSSVAPSSTLRIINERNQPYNLAFINDYFCYLASLISPNYDVEIQEDKVLLGIRLLKHIFSDHGREIGKKSCLIYITRNNICYNIVSILRAQKSPTVVSGTLDLAVDVFMDLRYYLKYQFETLLERLMEMLATNTDQSLDSMISINGGAELRADVLNSVLELFRNINHFPYELFYNYDCDPYSSNIYENLIQICSKNCFQQSLESRFTPIQLTSFKCLLSNLSDIHDVETGDNNDFVIIEPNSNQNESANVQDRTPSSQQDYKQRFPQTYQDLNKAKKRKRLLWLAVEKFNSRPKDSISFMEDNKLIDSSKPLELVQFLKDNPRVDKKNLGEYLSKKENGEVREAFIRSLDFTNLRIDEALRSMLEKFRLPGESQMIERILSTFSVHWFEQNKGILPSSDSALSLAYAIIMLNVDQHSKKVKPMTYEEFDRNLLGPKNERIYDKQLLDQIYTNIHDNEIVLPDEQVGQVRQKYLWKCTMVKSERPESLYWITGRKSKLDSKFSKLPRNVDKAPFQSIEPNNNLDKVELQQQIQDETPHSLPASITPTTLMAQPSQPFVMVDATTSLPDATVLVINERCLDVDNLSSTNGSIIQTDRGDDIVQQDLPLKEMNKILFEIMWSPTVAALSFIFDKIDTSIHPELSRQIVDQGFIKFAQLCAQHGHLDNLVVSLCKFTTDLSPIPHNHSGQRHLMSDKNSLAALSLLSIIRDYANCMRESWSNIVQNIIHWYRSRCIDDVVQVDDFALQKKLQLRMREIKKSPSTMNQQSSTFLRSVYTYFAGQQPANEGKVQNGTNCAPSAIQVLIQTIQDAEYSNESLVKLISALTTSSIDGDPEEVEDIEVFKLEIFTQVILNNKEQASLIWPRIRAYFARQSSLSGRSMWLGERIISASFRVAIQFKPKPEVFSLLGHIIANCDPDIVRGDHTFVALMTLTELHSTSVSMDGKELEACFNQVIFPFLDKVLDGCDPVLLDRTLNRAINLLSKIFLKHHKLLKELPTFALLWYAILDTMEKYIKANCALKEATFELVKNMVLVMDNEQCMSVEMKDITRTKFMFWEFQSGSDY